MAQRHHEQRKEPVTNHDNCQDIVAFGQIAGDTVLNRKNHGGQNHQSDAEGRSIGADGRSIGAWGDGAHFSELRLCLTLLHRLI